jgi:tight adherence protein B
MDGTMATWVLVFSIVLGFLATTAWLLRELGVVYKGHFTEQASTNLAELFLFPDPDRLFTLNLLALFIFPLLTWFYSHSFFHVALCFVGFLVLPRYVYRFLRKKRLLRFEAGLPDALAQMAGSMRAGANFAAALEHMTTETKGPIHQEFNVFTQEIRMGTAVDEAMENLLRRMPCESLRLMTSATLIARELGGNLSEIYGRLSESLRLKHAMEAKIDALTSQGKLQGWVVGMLPFGIMYILQQMESDAMAYLTTGLLGWIFLGIIIVMEVLGIMMIRKIVSIDI